MTINHLNLIVTDVKKSVQFFETYFGFNPELVKGDNIIVVLKNAENFTLVLMAAKMNQAKNSTYPDAFHIGFMLGSAAAVDAMHQKLVVGKIDIKQSPKKIRDSYAFYFHFDNLFIEIGHYLK